jgi:hypothetical protein
MFKVYNPFKRYMRTIAVSPIDIQCEPGLAVAYEWSHGVLASRMRWAHVTIELPAFVDVFTALAHFVKLEARGASTFECARQINTLLTATTVSATCAFIHVHTESCVFIQNISGTAQVAFLLATEWARRVNALFERAAAIGCTTFVDVFAVSI